MNTGNVNNDTPSPLDSSPNSFNGNGVSGEGGVNLGAIAGVPMSTPPSSSSLLAASSSSITPNPNEMRGRVPVVNSSLAVAAKAGGSTLRTSVAAPSQNQSQPQTNINPSHSQSPPQPDLSQTQSQVTEAPKPRAPASAPGTSSLAAAAGLVNNNANQLPVASGQVPPHQHLSYQDSQMQMQMHHQYPAQGPYRHGTPTQHQYPPPPQMQHPNMHPSQGAHGLHGQDYQQQHLAHHGYGQPTFPDHVTRPASGSEQGSESLGLGASQHDSEVEVGGDGDEGGDNGPVKLFVGQVPKTMEEADLTRAFQEYGEIKEILVIRDRHTGQHRGCAFVTFYNPADAARVQETLHDKFTFPEGRKPVQIKPASEPNSSMSTVITPEQENKLFIGMTSRNADEDSIRELFSPFGEIREIYIIRNADGSNKGCAFLKFADNESALNAIETLNDKFTMEGATRPLIVKFADTKAQRKARTNANARLIAGHRRVDQPGIHASPQAGYYLGPVPVYHNYQQAPPPMGMPPHQYTQPHYSGSYPQGTPPPPPPPHSYVYQQHPYAQTSPYGYPPPAVPYGPGQTHADGSPVTSSSAPYEGSTSASGAGATAHVLHSQPRSSLASRQQQNVGMPRTQKIYHRQEISGAVNPRPREGPAGANLFIYHLPHDLTDADLATAFNPFGNVISAKVYVDKFTGESKGFGFVSYDSVISAEQAIEQMNGFQIGSKRLKVQHKRVSKPPTGQQQPPMMPDNASVSGGIPTMHPDSNAVVGGLQGPPQQHHHQSLHHTQSLPSHLDVDGLAGDMQILDVRYADDDE